MESSAYSGMRAIEERHWWYVARRQLLARVLAQFTPSRKLDILEIGCGSGGNLPMLSRFGRVFGVEPDAHCRAQAASLGLGPVKDGSLPDSLPYSQPFDLICLFDVLEHVEDHSAALSALHQALKTDGRLVIAVPAFPILWSELDAIAHHRRRYTQATLLPLVRKAGFSVRYTTYFNTLLFPIILPIRLIQRLWPQPTASAHFRLPATLINESLRAIFALERVLIPRFSLPFGVSLLVVADKN